MDVLDRERWLLVSRRLDEALALDEDERAPWLSTLCDEDAALAADVQMLLDEHHELSDSGFLETSPPTPPRAGLAGQTVGAYTLVEPIGQGGMGTVWLAQRHDGRFDRRVAVKFLNVALIGRGEQRFTREGALLARLTHPHIAQLVDAGVSPAGQPFLILEHVDGEPIDRYGDRLQLGVDARVRLLLDVLDAVAHAHANLIVHRDIKPSNVLVDRGGHVKLLDFGIAKLLDTGNTAMATMLTREGGVGMTPEYAAPEQMTGAPITTATDVYALGVLAYLLLAGRHPAGDALRSTADILKAVVDTDAPRMSTVAAPAIRRQLRGDLDTIVSKMLRKVPVERYVSVTAVADDFRRYLAHQPISARRETPGYRARKFLRRNWLAVGAAALVVVALATGLLIANRQRVIAERRFQQLRRLSNNVIALDKSIRNLAGSTQARQALVTDSLEYLEGLAADARGDLDLALDLGEGYWRIARIEGVPTELNLGDFAKAEENLRKADALVERVLQARPADRAALYLATQIAHDRMIVAESEHRNADARAHAAQAGARIDAFMRRPDVTADERDRLAASYGNIALALSNMHRYPEAEAVARRAVEMSRALPAVNRRAQALSLLANILRYEGNTDAAVQTITEARAAAEAAEYPNDTFRMIDLYGVLLRQGMILGEDEAPNAQRPEEAVAAFQQALDLTEAAAVRDASDSTSRSRVATAARELGKILRHSDPARALAVDDLGLRRLGEIGGGNLKARRDTAVLLAESTYPLWTLGRGAEAKRRLARAFDVLRQTKDYPPRALTIDAEVYTVMRADADSLASEGRVADASAQYEQIRQQLIRSSPPTGDPRVSSKWDAFNRSLDALRARTSR